MTWFKVDDGFWSHPKTATLSDAAVTLWVRAGSYSCQHLTDGFVPRSALRLVGTESAAVELTSVGLWLDADNGWQFHDWDEYQETSEAVKQRRDAQRERQRRARAKRDESRRASRVTDTVSHGVSAQPPTRPDLIKNSAHRFDEFWSAYPRRVGRKAAEKSYAKALDEISEDELISAARAYASAASGADPKFIAHPTTWLNQGRWDEYADSPSTSPERFLNDCWERGSVGRITELTGHQPECVRWPDPIPDDFDQTAHVRDSNRRWIKDHRDELVQALGGRL